MTAKIIKIFGLAFVITVLACAHYPSDGEGDGDQPDGSCTGDCPPDGGTPPDGGNPPACADDGDCGCGESCVGGACTQTSCCADGDCRGGQVCDTSTGECGPPECSCDGDCGCGEQCSGGSCDPGCAHDGDCCGEDVCRAGSCEPPPPDQCSCDSDCPTGKTCEGGACVCDGDSDDGGDGACRDGKLLLCHYPPGNPGNRHEICVGWPAKPAHLAHGDTLGTCP